MTLKKANFFMISNDHRGSIYAITSGFLYGFLGYFGISAMNASMSVTNMLFWRFLIASVVIMLLAIRQIKQAKHSFKDMSIAFANGAIFYGFSTMFYFFACPYIGSGLAMVIFFTYPAMVMILNHFLYGQKIQTIYYFTIAIIIIGMCFFIDMNEMEFDLLGILLSIASGFLYAAYIVSSKKIATLSPNVSTLMVCLGCMAPCLICALANHSFVIPHTFFVWKNLLGIGIISTTIPILLLLYSLNYISSEKAAILSVLEPVFVLIFGVTLLGEPMKWQYAIGVIIVLGGALLTLFSNQQTNIMKKESVQSEQHC
jgi:drug/metabolite transporter (DMT)-like permease